MLPTFRQLPALIALVYIGCGTSKPVERPAREGAVPARPPVVIERDLYAADEALRDVLSGELEYIGTGRWPGVERSSACAFRNSRVLVVNAYCTLTETPAFRIDVYSPVHGRVRIYGEANGPISSRHRGEYFTFVAESDAPPGSDARIAPVALTMSYQQLQSYEQQRYDAYLPGCFGGEQHQRTIGGCLGTLAPRKAQWVARNRNFLEHANEDWYRVIRQMRALAQRYGRDPD